MNEAREATPHWMRFSIKSMLIIMLVVAAFFAGKISEQRKAAEQAKQATRRAMLAEQQARMIAEQAMRQAQTATSQAESAR